MKRNPANQRSIVSENTENTYGYCLQHWREFTKTKIAKRWSDQELEFSVLSWLDDFRNRGLSTSTVFQHLAALSWFYGSERIRSESVRRKIERYARELGKPKRKAVSIGLEQLQAMVSVCKSLRSKALLSVAWAGALRASEITSVMRSHLTKTENGYALLIPRSKTDQYSEGRTLPLPYYHIQYASICPSRNLDAYLAHQADFWITENPDYFLWPIATRTVSRLVKRAARRAGFVGSGFSSHSLRRGLATTAVQHGIDDRTLMRHGRWLTRDVVDGYVDEGSLWSRTALDFLR